MLKSASLVAASSLCWMGSSALAQNQNSSQNPARSKTEGRADISRPMVSLTAVLQLSDEQTSRLNRVYNDFSTRNFKAQNDLAQRQQELRRAQSPVAFDETKAARLTREINRAQQNISTDFLSARAKALRILEPVQRAQLESLVTDTRFQLRNDVLTQLLVLPVDQVELMAFSATPPSETGRYRGPRDSRQGRNSGTATYGVYGGYGYGGPQYGVHGGYGRGPVGVNIGIGRSGPSVSIGIGGIFGGGFGR